MSDSPFTFIKSINDHQYIMTDRLAEKAYVPYITNISFSMFDDTLFLANEMNRYFDLPHAMQYDFYFNAVRPRKRFKKWIKRPHEADDVKLIAEIYKYNFKRARQALSVLSHEQLETIKKKYNKGGLDD